MKNPENSLWNTGAEASRILLSEEPFAGKTECAFTEEGLRGLEAWNARPGEVLSVIAPSGRVFRARMIGEKGRMEKALCFEDLGMLPALPRLHLFQALPEKERFELILEKAVELGADAIHPFVSKKSTSLEERDLRQKKSHRWPHLLQRAARQCRRPEIPALYPVGDFSSVLEKIALAGLSLVLDEREKKRSFAEGVQRYEKGEIALIVGPEGGFDRSEIAILRERGAIPVTLGDRILRTETAAILAVGLLRHGNFF